MFVKRLLMGLLILCVHSLALAGPAIQTWTTAQGARVYYVPSNGLPLVDMRLMFAAGSARDEAQYGVAALTSSLLDSGAGAWDADAIAQRLERVGAVLGTGVSQDAAWLSLRSLTDADKLGSAVETLHAVLTQPRFAERDFAREKQRVLLAIQAKAESPAAVAADAYAQALYGEHPYAHPDEGVQTTVKTLKRADLQRFYQRYYVAANAVVAIVGAVDRAQAEHLVDQMLTGLPTGQAAAALPAVSPGAAKQINIAFPSKQTHAMIGLPVLAYNDPDQFPLVVGNHILGGSGFVSRIVKEVREQRGLAYSAYSYFTPQAALGPFTMGLQTRNEQAAEAVRVLLDTAQRFIAEGPTEAELAAAKQNIIGGFALRLDSNQKITEYVAAIGFYRLPLDYLDTYTSKVEAVTVADIARAFKARVDPNQLRTVLVGGGTPAAQ